MTRPRPKHLIPLVAAMLAATSGCGLFPAPSGLSPGAHELASAERQHAAYSERRVVVTLKPGSELQAKTLLTGRLGLKMIHDMPQLGMCALDLPAHANRDALLSSLASEPSVASVEADARVHANYQPQDPDSTLGMAGAYDAFRAELSKAWDITTGDPHVVIAVVDTGIDLTHPELRDHLVPGQNFVTEVEVSADGSSDPNAPKKLVSIPDHGPMDDGGHGTHVAGILGAAENGQGITGVAPRCMIMPVKSLAYTESGEASDVANGVVWATDHGARVINMSLGAYGGSKALEKAVAYAIAHRVVVVAAMGNDRDDPTQNYGTDPSYPAALPGVIAVGATDEDDQLTTFSNVGRWISVSAPGNNIYSTLPSYPTVNANGLDYGLLSGTSMATPFVTGAVALLLSVDPDLTPQQVKARLEATADDLGPSGFDTQYGHGRLNPYRLLQGS